MTVSQFANDIAIYCKWGPLDSSKRLLLRALGSLDLNLRDLGLDLSLVKTRLIYLNRKGISSGGGLSSIRWFDHYELCDCQVFSKFDLGIVFDYKLYFGSQIEEVRKKCSRALNLIKFVRGTWWGANRSTLLTMYISFVRIYYGVFIYFPSNKRGFSKLDSIQSSAIRMSLGLRSSTSKNLLLAESKLLGNRDRAVYLC